MTNSQYIAMLKELWLHCLPPPRPNSTPESSTSIRTKRSFTSPTTTPNLRMSSPKDSVRRLARCLFSKDFFSPKFDPYHYADPFLSRIRPLDLSQEAAKCSCDTPPNSPSPGVAALPQMWNMWSCRKSSTSWRNERPNKIRIRPITKQCVETKIMEVSQKMPRLP